MGKKIVIALVIIGFLSVPGIARAAFFDGGPWYMDSSWWVDYSDGNPPSGTAELVDTPSNDRLDWLTSGWTSGEDVFRAKVSKWAFVLNKDFEFAVGFHYDHTGAYNTDEGGIEMGLYYFDDPSSSEPSHTFSIAADNWVSDWGSGLSNKNVFWSSMELPNQEADSWWERTKVDGLLWAQYDASEDELRFAALENTGSGYDVVGGAEYDNLKSELGISQLGVYLGGWSEGAGLASGKAYLEDFNVNKGTITPEPVSSILFLVGAAPLAYFRYRKKKSARA